jgi:hypothetical protein
MFRDPFPALHPVFLLSTDDDAGSRYFWNFDVPWNRNEGMV